jgi:cytochrome c
MNHRRAVCTSTALSMLAALPLLLAAASAHSADIDAGKVVFNRCKICHTLEAGERHTLGPNLHGIYGRKAATIEGFQYSDALKDSGITWDDETLARYLHDPKEAIPGNRMAFPGVKDEQQMADLLAYLKESTK